MPSILRPCLLAVLAIASASSAALADNRFVIGDVTLPVGSSGNVVPVLLDADQDVFGISLYLEYDPAALRIVAIESGADLAAADPEWTDGTIDDVAGDVRFGVLFGLSEPTIARHIPAGAGREMLRLIVDVLAPSTGATTLDLTRVPDSSPLRANVITNGVGASIEPALVDGNVSLEDHRPVILGLTGNEGQAGATFAVTGDWFDRPGLAVTLCGQPADFVLRGDGRTLDVVAPPCAPGLAAIEVCNDLGCDVEPAGFTYTLLPGAPVIESFAGNAGKAGTVFTIAGTDFDQPGLRVEVCAAAAVATLLPDGRTLEVIAPLCIADGPVRVTVCTALGCDVDDAGFRYDPQVVFLRGNANDDEEVDISDGIAVLVFLFRGGAAPDCVRAADADDNGAVEITDAVRIFNYLFLAGPAMPAPFGACGRDTTLDALGCEALSPACGA